MSSSFLEVSCSVESETTSLNFSYSFTLKSFGLSSILNELPPMYDIVTSHIGHLKNTDSLTNAGLVNVDTFNSIV